MIDLGTGVLLLVLLVAAIRASPAVRRVLGFILIAVAPAITLAMWHSTRADLVALAEAEGRRVPNDSPLYASAAYHAARARASHANRWHPTGYATLGGLGFVIGAGLLYSGSAHRPRTKHVPAA